MNHGSAFRWDDGLAGPARNIAGLDHTPIRVLAGPGTGKTFALMRRVARLLQGGAEPNRILVCTFTQDLERKFNDSRDWLDHPHRSPERKGWIDRFEEIGCLDQPGVGEPK